MKFGRMAVAAGEGAILAHSLRGQGVALRKGEVIGGGEIEALEAAGIEGFVGALLEPGDVAEDLAALELARRVAGAHVCLERPFTGRCNLLAAAAGLVCIDRAVVDAINAQDEAITVATLPPMQPVVEGEMIATVKIIPFAVRRACLDRSLAPATAPSVHVAPWVPLKVGVISTLLPSLKAATVTKTLRVLQERLDSAGSTIAAERRVPHDAPPLAEAIATIVSSVDLVVIFGASAITDRRDVVPVAIEMAGGRVEHLGMPVDPGNLLLLARLGLDGRGPVPIIGAPGCARSPKENGFDFVLRRFLAGLPVAGADLRRLGVGGLLGEIVTRPQLRRGSRD